MSMPLDHLDKQLALLLRMDGRLPAAHLSEKLNVTPPTIRSRIQSLIQSGILRVAGLINAAAAPDIITALIGIDIESHGQLTEKLELLTRLDMVHWAAVVTGRYDIIAEVVVTGGMDNLYKFTSEALPTVGRIIHCETFVVLRSSRKWLYLPEGMDNW
jgi:Lrp/AsnC family transcriptional regulator, regulator for asnA, asnC and gidA